LIEKVLRWATKSWSFDLSLVDLARECEVILTLLYWFYYFRMKSLSA
jgi:hypothetical protein